MPIWGPDPTPIDNGPAPHNDERTSAATCRAALAGI